MKSLRTVGALLAALGLGIIVTSLIPGCDAQPGGDMGVVAELDVEAVRDSSDASAASGASESTIAETSRSEPSSQLSAGDVPTAGDSEPAPTPSNAADSSTAGAAAAVDKQANAPIKPGDWPQWAGTSYRNNTPIAENIPTQWEVGRFDRKTGQWIPDDARNIKWVAQLGSQSYGNPVIAAGRILVGTNNGAGYLTRYPADVDLGCLLCFDEADGKFLWQASSEKLPTGRVHDWPLQGICCAPLVEGNRLWYVTSRGEVVCLDTEGFYDGEDDGPVQQELGRLFDIRRSKIRRPTLSDRRLPP